MNTTPLPSHNSSLRAKLVLSYLGVTLGTLIFMIIVVAIAVPNYFYTSQISQLRADAQSWAQQLAQDYQQSGNNWEGFRRSIITGWHFPRDLIVSDAEQNIYISFAPTPTFAATIKQALNQTLTGQEVQGTLTTTGTASSGPGSDSNGYGGFYACEPILVNGKVVGAVMVIQPDRLAGFSTADFVLHVNLLLLITGLGLALVVVIFSLFMARRLTHPLVSLTRAAEEMKRGNYAERVEEPATLDELGTLALTFNSMADKIASDVHELRQQEQLRRDLTANIAHDLITPLTAIQGYSEAIADDVITNPVERHETAQLIGREVQRLRRLVKDMQNMTALESGHLRLEMEPLNLHDLVTETLAVIAPECEQAQITLRNEIEPTTPLVLADSDRLTQVLLNLLDNARRHTPPGGQITLGARAEHEQNRLIAWVSDTGVGISPQDLPYIFERFYRVDRSRAAASGGTGLGLAIIKAIIAAHGGSVWARSIPQQGTTIFFTLPLAPTSPNPDLPAAPASQPAHP